MRPSYYDFLNNCKSLLIGLPFSKLFLLLSILNAAARLIFLSSHYTEASTLHKSLSLAEL